MVEELLREVTVMEQAGFHETAELLFVPQLALASADRDSAPWTEVGLGARGDAALRQSFCQVQGMGYWTTL